METSRDRTEKVKPRFGPRFVRVAREMTMTRDETDEFIPIAKVGDLAPGQMKRFVVSSRAVVIANVDGNYFAFEDRCLHWGVKLSDGCLEGNVVRCRAHGWKHDVVRGEIAASEPPGDEGRRINTFKVEIKDDAIFVGGRVLARKTSVAT
jgi:3-phenylpropionate/trans-cinnamate dioxygenase ferredoxin subunit